MTPNRTIVELKYKNKESRSGGYATPNRTIVELKSFKPFNKGSK